MSDAVAAIRDEVRRLRTTAEHYQRDLDAGKRWPDKGKRQVLYEIEILLKDAAELERQAVEMENRLAN